MMWIQLEPRADPNIFLGEIPDFLSERDPRSAKQQINDNYCSGWVSQRGCTIDAETRHLKYPGDPDMPPLFMSLLGDEWIYVYECAWVAIIQQDGSYEVARLD